MTKNGLTTMLAKIKSLLDKKMDKTGTALSENDVVSFKGTSGTFEIVSSGSLKIIVPDKTGSWARSITLIRMDNAETLGAIGFRGTTNDGLMYYYIGADWDNANIKIYNDGRIIAQNVDILARLREAMTLNAGTVIKSGTDLDELSTPGVYVSPRAEISATLGNCPYKTAGFRLETRKILSTEANDSVVQLLFPNSNSGVFYIRSRSNVNGYSLWRKHQGEVVDT